MNRTPENGMERGGSPSVARLEIGQLLLNQLFAEARAASWGIDRDAFAATLQLSAKKHFVEDIPAVAKLEGYFFSLHPQASAKSCRWSEKKYPSSLATGGMSSTKCFFALS